MGWHDMRPWGIKLRYIILAAFALMIFTHPPKSCQNGIGHTSIVKIASGDLGRVYPTLEGKPFNVAMKNGAIETSRENDIEELARDYWHFKNRAVDMLAKNDMQGLAEAEQNFRQTEAFLKKYNEADVSFMVSHVAKR
jgi:hypothetical protein